MIRAAWMPSIRANWVTTALLCLLWVPIAGRTTLGEEVDPDALIKKVAASLKSGQLDTAIEDVIRLDDAAKQKTLSDVEADTDVSSDADVRIDTMGILAQTARAIEQSAARKRYQAKTTELYKRAVAANQRSASTALSAKQVALIHLAAGSSLARADEHEAAIDALTTVMELSDELTDRQMRHAGQLVGLLGSKLLTEQKPVLAERAYLLAADHLPESPDASAQLGLAWSLAMQDDRQSDAADKLSEFVRRNPNHSDVSQALGLCVGCLRQAKRSDEAAEMASILLIRYASSPAAASFVRRYQDVPLSEVPDSVRTWLMGRGVKDEVGNLSSKNAVLAMMVAADEKQSQVVDRLATHLATTDEGGEFVSAALQGLSDQGFAADAQRVSGSLLAGDLSGLTLGAREAACRWAGQQQHWMMLALASEDSDPKTEEPTRNAGVERLFAESLMQVGRQADAKIWWEHLVDTRHADDFLTLLRCAETAAALSPVDMAKKRAEAARLAAGSDVNQFSLVEMLSAEIDVRELKFDEARMKLQQVVESETAIATLRGRAQWTIGETHYMQQKFADAIEAYRTVETVDPGGSWIAVSLVQAGKAFEQLGRTREATVCYSTLISRFAESPYAATAQRRMAALDPETNSTDETIRR